MFNLILSERLYSRFLYQHWELADEVRVVMHWHGSFSRGIHGGYLGDIRRLDNKILLYHM